MSKERELLERALDKWIIGSDDDIQKVMDEIGEFLSEPEQDEEPVAWTCQDELNALGTDVTCYMYAEPLVGETNIPLYLHPAPRPDFVRLSEEEVNNLLDACGVGRDWNYQLICAVENRLVEKNK